MKELHKRGHEYATISTAVRTVHPPHVPSATFVTGLSAMQPIQVSVAPPLGVNSVSLQAQDSDRSKKGASITPINVDLLEQNLSNHPDRPFVTKLCTNLREGAKIGYEGPRTTRFSKNLPTALALPGKIQENLDKEVGLGRTAGPFTEPPLKNFQVSPIGLVPKKHSNKYRTIFHLSYPKSGCSINSSINKEDFSLTYVTIDDAIQAIQQLGEGAFLAKTDIESAFRLIPVHPDDWELLGMQWGGLYYYDKVLPFGLRSAPFLFNQLSEAVEWILYDKCQISYVAHFLDDFLIIEPENPITPNQSCKESLTSMCLTFKALNIPLATGKTEGPSQVLEFLGIILDSRRMEARLPEDKVVRLKEELHFWLAKRSATLVQLQSLIGVLNFACKVVPAGRAFLQRIISLTVGVTKPHHHIYLGKGFREDIRMWQSFLCDWNGKAFFLNHFWESSSQLKLFTDASGRLGFGGIFGASWFQGRWSPSQLLDSNGISIAWQELYAIVVACSIWGNLWSQKRITFFCDNEAVVRVVNSRRSKCPKIMELVRVLTLTTMQHNFYFFAKHIPGVRNEIADSLSRFQVERFRDLAPWADAQPQQIPPHLLEL